MFLLAFTVGEACKPTGHIKDLRHEPAYKPVKQLVVWRAGEPISVGDEGGIDSLEDDELSQRLAVTSKNRDPRRFPYPGILYFSIFNGKECGSNMKIENLIFTSRRSYRRRGLSLRRVWEVWLLPVDIEAFYLVTCHALRGIKKKFL